MREILFRGKQKENGQWAIGSFHIYETRQICPINDKLQPEEIKYLIIRNSFADWNMPRTIESAEVDPKTIGQFTGLIVSNVRVFEGDFLKFGDRIFEVFWNNEAFQWQAKQVDTDLEIHRTCGGCHDYDWTITDLGWFTAEEIITGKMTTEIIGNKWDTPEIVEKNRNRKGDYFRCMEEHDCLDCDERCSTYGDCYFCDNEPLNYCENCFYEYRKNGVDDE